MLASTASARDRVVCRTSMRVSVLVVLAAVTAGACAHHEPLANREGSAGREPNPHYEGTLGGHYFTITLEGGELAKQDARTWQWRLPGGEATVADHGAATDQTKFLVQRSPRTIVRIDGGYHVITEVVLDVGGREFGCSYHQRVADPDGPEGKAAAERGVATCTSFRVDPR
jgi:hypothetical protein